MHTIHTHTCVRQGCIYYSALVPLREREMQCVKKFPMNGIDKKLSLDTLDSGHKLEQYYIARSVVVFQNPL